MAKQGDVRKADRYFPDDIPAGFGPVGGERARIREEASKMTEKYRREKYRNTSPEIPDKEEKERRSRNYEAAGRNEADLGNAWNDGGGRKPYQYARGGKVKKPGKKAVMAAVMAAHQAGIQKGAAMASPRPSPAVPPPGAGAPPPGIAGLRPGMKAGGKVKKEKFVPPWMKKEKKFSAGGSVGGGRGDGCASRGRTRGRMC